MSDLKILAISNGRIPVTEIEEGIKIGDEVEGIYTGNRYVITSLDYDGDSSILCCSDGARVQKSKVRRTGKSFPELAEVLDRIRKR